MLGKLIQQLKTLFNKYGFYVFLTSLVLIKLPPVYFFPLLRNGLLTTHTLSRGMIAIVVLYIVVGIIRNHLPNREYNGNKILPLYLGYLFLISASILSAENISAFIQRYKDIVFPGLFLFATIYFKERLFGIISVLMVSSIFNFVYQIILFIIPDIFRTYGKYIIYSGHYDLVLINLNRSRIFVETYDEMFIPFTFLMMASKNKLTKVFGIVLLILLVIPGLLSNFRSRILMIGVSLLMSFLFISGKKAIINKLIVGATVLVMGITSVYVLNNSLGFSFVDRFTLQDPKEDVGTIDSRWENIEQSIEMGAQKPLTGVGLGNYYDYLPNSKTSIFTLINWVNREAEIAATNPHNIFAQILSETGVVSLLFFVAIIGYFAYLDVRLLFDRKGNQLKKAVTISFWTLFSYSLVNPATTLTYNSYFWIIRGLI